MFSSMKSLALIGAAALTFVPLACQAGETQETPASGAAPQVPAIAAPPPTPIPPTPVPSNPVPAQSAPVTPTQSVEEKLKLQPSVTELVSPTPGPLNTPIPTPDPSSAPMRLTFGWDQTDFTKHSMPFSEIRSGGPSRDDIPLIDVPIFLPVGDTPDYMNDK